MCLGFFGGLVVMIVVVGVGIVEQSSVTPTTSGPRGRAAPTIHHPSVEMLGGVGVIVK